MGSRWQVLRRRLEFEYTRLRAYPLRVLAQKLGLKMLGSVIGLLLLPLTVILHVAGFRRVDFFLDRIGHLAIEPDCLLRDQALGLVPARKWVMLAPSHRVANSHLLRYWEPHFLVIRSRLLCFVIQSATRWKLGMHDASSYMRAIGRTQSAYRVYRDWGRRPPVLQLSAEDIEWGAQQLELMGVPRDAWFVCLHVREAGFSPVDEELHRHRNADIHNTCLAVEEIVRRGGWVIRLGDPSMTPMPAMPQTIDYAHHPLRSPRLDIYLCARSRFILGNTSGIAIVGTIFGVPSALANMIPITAMGYERQDISIPKLIWSSTEQAYVSMRSLIDQGLGSAQYYSQYLAEGVVPEENSAEDILDLTLEMFDSLDSEVRDPEALRLQAAFSDSLRDGDYAYKAASSTGARFLRKHQDKLKVG
ncbi:TIGR04372 family glycosyltransferase [Viridibacterium curvum]|uniref:TIGR04372 family glycosyltransferase n=1 Tax=Viridibacterium curvum TaxID=1101404 RepID=A0ABP9QLA4_9RHOO